jgi:membrane protein CcdC involved in cytochrome C biogenesis
MSIVEWIGNLLVPVAVLGVDFGRRRLTVMRILRPFVIAAVVVPFVMPGFDLHGSGLLLESAAIVAGVLLGAGTAMLMRVEHDAGTGWVFTLAGTLYAAVWIAVGAARLLFSYESTHSAAFARALGQFLIGNHISVTALADAILFVGFAMMIANRAVLLLRSRRLKPPLGGPSSSDPLATAPATEPT